MALFPATPANGDTANVNGITYTYYSNQTAWVRTGTFLADFTAGNGTFSGNVTANFFIGNGSQLTGITTSSSSISNGNSNVNIPTANGNVNITAVGNTTLVVTGTGANVTGTLGVSSNVTSPQLISNVSTGTAPLVVSSNTVVSNLNADLLDGYNTATANTANTVAVRDASGNLSANFFTGNGSQLTGIITSVSNVSNGNSNVNIPAANGNIQVSVAGTANVITFTSNNAYRGAYGLTGAISQGNTAPSNPQPGDQWYNTFNGILFEYIDDGTSAQWVDVNGLPGVVGPIILPGGTANAVVYLSSTGETISSSSFVFDGTNVTAPGFTSTVATGTAPLTVSSNTLVSNLNADLLDGFNAATANTANTVAVRDASGNVNANFFIGNGSQLTGIATGTPTSIANGNSTVNIPAVNGNVNITAVGNATLIVTGTGVNVAGTLNATGNANVGNIGATNGVFTNVSGNGNSLSSLQGANVTGQVANALVAGTVYTAAQPNITSVGTLTSATVTGNVAAGNLTTTGVLSVTGTGVSSIAGNLDMTSNTIINLATPTNPDDAATKQYVDDVAQGLHTHDSCNAATQTTLATISGGTVTYNNGTSGVGATLTTTGTYTTIDGVTLSNGMRILVKNEANTAHNGIYDRTSTTVLTRSIDFNTPAEMAGGDFTFVTAGTLYDNTGWVMVDAVTTVGTSPVEWVQFSGAGTYTAGTGLTLNGSQFNISNTAVTAATYGNGDRVASFTVNAQGQLTNAANTVITANAANLTGTTLNSGIVTSSLTSVGTLTSLNVSGNANVGNLGTAQVLATANITAPQIISNVATGTQPLLVTSTTKVVNLNVEQVDGYHADINPTASNIAVRDANANISANFFIGNGSQLTGISASFPIANGNSNVNVPAANGNINFSVAGNANVLVVTGTGITTGTGTGGNISGANNISANTFTGTLTTAAQPNITSVGTLTSLNVSGSVTSGNLADAVGYKGLPQNQQVSAYTLTLADQGDHIYATAGTFAITIPANATTAFPVGTAITIIVEDAVKTVVPDAGVTLVLAGTGAATTGTRTMAIGSVATIIKVQTNRWYISGVGVT